MGLFWAAHGWRQKGLLPKICHSYPTIMKIGSYKEDPRTRSKKIRKSRDTLLSSNDFSNFSVVLISPEITKFWYIKKYI